MYRNAIAHVHLAYLESVLINYYCYYVPQCAAALLPLGTSGPTSIRRPEGQSLQTCGHYGPVAFAHFPGGKQSRKDAT